LDAQRTIKKEDGRVLQEGPGDCNALFLATRKADTTLTDS